MRDSAKALLVLGGLLGVGLLSACSGAKQRSSPPTVPEAKLTTAERSKIDQDLLYLMTDTAQVTDIPSTRRPDGTRAYAVRIVTSDVEALRKAGVTPDSVADGTVWTRLSLAEIRGLARMKAVTAIQANNDPLPR